MMNNSKEHEQVRKYDAWLHFNLGILKCNLKCNYCCFVQDQLVESQSVLTITSILAKIKRLPQTLPRKALKLIQPVRKPKAPFSNLPALLKTLDKTNLVFALSFFATYGDPFLVSNMVNACVELTRKHFIAFCTNLTPSSVAEFAERIDPKQVIKIHASLHIKELERQNMTHKYIDNFLLLKEKGFNINAVEVAYPGLADEVDRYREFFRFYGIDLTFTPFLGVYDEAVYPLAYSDRELTVFGLNKEDISNRHQCGQPCNAGYNAAIVDPYGDVFSCDRVKKCLGNIYEEFHFNKMMIKCPADHCGCPLNVYDQYLFKRALQETSKCG